jgi:hypothetical protein
MRDSFDTRLQTDNAAATTGIGAIFSRIMQAFCVLHRISWSAPWAEQKQCRS